MVGLTVIIVVSGTMPTLEPLFYSPVPTLKSYSDQAIFTFLFYTRNRVNSTSELDPWDIPVAVVFLFSEFAMNITFAMCDICVFAHVISLWVIVSDCYTYVKEEVNSEVTTSSVLTFLHSGSSSQIFLPRVCSILGDIHDFSEAINEALCNQMAWCIAECSFYYPIHFSKILFPANEYDRVYFVTFTILAFGNLFLAADVKAKVMTTVERVIMHNYKRGLSKDYWNCQLLTTMQECIGVRGNEKFMVTFGFLGGVSGKL